MKRWSLAMKEYVGGDVKGLLAAFDDPLDAVEVEGVGARVVNPAQVGGGVEKRRMVDTSRVDVDGRSSRRDGEKWFVSLVVKNELGRKYGQNHLRQEAANAFLPETRNQEVHRSRAISLNTASHTAKIFEGADDTKLTDETIQHAGLKQEILKKNTSHPLSSGAAVTSEDSMAMEMESDRRDDAEKRLKYELFTNKITQRAKANQFEGDNSTPGKSLWRFFYDGDDMAYVPNKPIWRQNAERRRGAPPSVGRELDSAKLKSFQKYIRRVSQLGSPETIGDLQKMLSEQRGLLVEMRGEEFQSGHRYTAMLNRRDNFYRRRGLPGNVLLKEAVHKEKPLEERIVEKRRDNPKKMLTPDEAHELARHDVEEAKKNMKYGRENIKTENWADERNKKLLPASSTATDNLPDHKRATAWLSEYSMSGAVEDPRETSPFTLAKDPHTTLTSEDKGREVGKWEANTGAGLPGTHRPVAEKISAVFDYQRAADRVTSGLQEKAFADWRPKKPVEEEVFEKTRMSKGGFERRPVGFWSKTNPDLRSTKEWDDVLGAPVTQDGISIDKIRFYQVRARWEKRKELATKFGLAPRPDESLAERDARRIALDQRLEQVLLDKSADTGLLSAWSDDRRNEQWYGRRNFRVDFADRSSLYPASVRPEKDLLAYQAVSTMSIREADLQGEQRANFEFNRKWFQDDAAVADLRRGDPRMDYLSTCGITPAHYKHAMGCAHYMQIQDALWELRVYRSEPEPSPADKTLIEETTFINMMDENWAKNELTKIEKELDAKIAEGYRTHSVGENDAVSVVLQGEVKEEKLGWKSPSDIDKWRTSDGSKEGLEIEREMSYPVAEVNNTYSHRWLAKTPWDRIAANDLAAKMLRPEDDARGSDLGASFYFNRSRLHYYRLPVQKYKAFGPEIRELKFLSEKIVPHTMASKMKNYYAVARHNTIPFFSNHIGKNGPKFMSTPKVSFDHLGLHDDLEDYIRINPHLAKWEEM